MKRSVLKMDALGFRASMQCRVEARMQAVMVQRKAPAANLKLDVSNSMRTHTVLVIAGIDGSVLLA